MAFSDKYNEMLKLEQILEENYNVDSKYIRECRRKYCRLLNELVKGD